MQMNQKLNRAGKSLQIHSQDSAIMTKNIVIPFKQIRTIADFQSLKNTSYTFPIFTTKLGIRLTFRGFINPLGYFSISNSFSQRFGLNGNIVRLKQSLKNKFPSLKGSIETKARQ